MKVYLTGSYEWRQTFLGYGVAAHHSYETMKLLGLDVKYRDKDSEEINYDADIEICMNYGNNYTFYCDRSYKIGYSPWESTTFPADWLKGMSKCDEVWVTSNWVKFWLEKQLPNKEIFVYTHGLDPLWVPKKRTSRNKPFTFLHIGEPFSRKDGQMVVDTFVKLYGNNSDYLLIMKCSQMNTTYVTDPVTGQRLSPSSLYSNILIYESYFDDKQMKTLYNNCDVFLYPSWGEGFGFNPLQAISMGIPVISTSEWAEYKEFITLPISSRYEISPWQEIHPGMMLKPNAKEFELAMRYAVNNYEDLCNRAWKNCFEVHKKFDWDIVTKPAVERLKNIYNSRIKNSSMVN